MVVRLIPETMPQEALSDTTSVTWLSTFLRADWWSGVAVLATIAAGVAVVLVAAQHLRFQVWAKLQEVFTDPDFTDARGKVLAHPYGPSSAWTDDDRAAAFVVCRKMDEFCRLIPFFGVVPSFRRRAVLKVWKVPIGKCWALVEWLIQEEQDRSPEKWSAFQQFGKIAFDKSNPSPPDPPDAHHADPHLTCGTWDLSQERQFVEGLVHQRFNFFLIFYSLVIAGALAVRTQEHLQIILGLGALLLWLCALPLFRAQYKLELIMKRLPRNHPATVIDLAAKKERGTLPWPIRHAAGRSRIKLLGYWIPLVCALSIFVGFVLAMIGVIAVIPNG